MISLSSFFFKKNVTKNYFKRLTCKSDSFFEVIFFLLQKIISNA